MLLANKVMCKVCDPTYLASRQVTARIVIVVFVVLLSIFASSAVCEQAEGHEAPSYSAAAAVLALSPEQAAKGYHAQIRGVVTQSLDPGLVIHDATAGIWVYLQHAERYSSGQAIEVQGRTSPGLFAPVIFAESIRVLGHAPLPKPQAVSFKQLSTGDFDNQYVSVIGSIRSVEVQSLPGSERLVLKLALDRGFLTVTLPIDDLQAISGLTDALVRITGTAMCSKNDSRQIIAPTLAVPGVRNIMVLKPPTANPFSKPLIPIGGLMQYRSGVSFYERVHVIGTVTYYRPGTNLILEDSGSALYVTTGQDIDLSVGDRVEALGFAAPQAGGPILEDAVLRRVSVGPAPVAKTVQLADICSGKLNYNLVSTEGHLLGRLLGPSRETLLLQDKASVLVAELSTTGSKDALAQIRDGSVLRLSGISVLDVEGMWNYGLDSAQAVHCKILLRTPSDIQVAQLPTWWTTRHVLYIAVSLGALALLFLIQVVRSLIERSRLRATLAERERVAHEIHDTLAQSFAGIAFQLQAILRAIPRDLAHVQQQVELARDLVRHSHKEARRSIEPLQPESEEVAKILSALEESAQRMVKGAIKISAVSEGTPRALSPRVADALLKIGQEAIANAVRHADPSQVEIALTYRADTVTLSVHDDGVGFVKSGNLLGFGLRGMRKRAAAVSADLAIESQPGKGTKVTVTAQLPSISKPAMAFRTLWRNISGYSQHASSE